MSEDWSTNFDPSKVESTERKPAPRGTYDFIVHSLEDKEVNGCKLYALRIDVTGPTEQGTVVFDNFWRTGKQERAHQISMERFAALCKCVGSSTAKGVVGKRGKAVLKVTEATDKYKARNEVAEYIPKDAGAASANAPKGAPW